MKFLGISPRRGSAVPLLLAACSLLPACAPLTVRTQAATSVRSMAPAAAAAAKPVERPPLGAAEGLKLARLLRDQGRFEAAVEVYARLEERGQLQPLELLEYATVAAQVRPPQDSLALFGRVRRALAPLGAQPPAVTVALCGGLGRSRLALGQTDAALEDFDCVLAAEPENVNALNARAVLLDARGEHAQAQLLLRQALRLEPADLRIVNNLGLSLLAAGDTGQAVRVLSQAESAQWPALKLNLAFAYSLQGQPALARQALAGIMDAALVPQALADLEAMRGRVQAGAPVSQELLAASRRLLPLREQARHG